MFHDELSRANNLAPFLREREQRGREGQSTSGGDRRARWPSRNIWQRTAGSCRGIRRRRHPRDDERDAAQLIVAVNRRPSAAASSRFSRCGDGAIRKTRHGERERADCVCALRVYASSRGCLGKRDSGSRNRRSTSSRPRCCFVVVPPSTPSRPARVRGDIVVI